MEKVLFTNKYNEWIEFNKSLSAPSYLLQFIDGISGLEVDIQTVKAPYQTGDTYLDTKINPRMITVVFSILARNDFELENMRAYALKILNPNNGMGVFSYTFGDKNYNIVPSILTASVAITNTT